MSDNAPPKRLTASSTKQLVQKYWIFFVGFLMVFASLLYIIKLGLDQGWISPAIILFGGLLLGIGGLIAGFSLYRKNWRIFAEIMAGFACSILYATIVYAKLVIPGTT